MNGGAYVSICEFLDLCGALYYILMIFEKSAINNQVEEAIESKLSISQLKRSSSRSSIRMDDCGTMKYFSF